MRYGAEAATDVELEAAFFQAVYGLNHADAAHVVHIGQAAGLVFAAGEGDLEFAAEILGIGMTQKKIGASFGIGCHIKALGATYPSQWAGRDVAH